VSREAHKDWPILNSFEKRKRSGIAIDRKTLKKFSPPKRFKHTQIMALEEGRKNGGGIRRGKKAKL